MSQAKEQNFFEKFGLEVSTGDVEVGKTYPIYGMITDIFNNDNQISVEINYSIVASMNLQDDNKIETLKERAFEPGIFISTVTDKDDTGKVQVDCQTVVFGRKQYQAV